MSNKSQREWRFYMDDMMGFAEQVLRYTKNLDREAFPEIRERSPRNPLATNYCHPEPHYSWLFRD